MCFRAQRPDLGVAAEPAKFSTDRDTGSAGQAGRETTGRARRPSLQQGYRCQREATCGEDRAAILLVEVIVTVKPGERREHDAAIQPWHRIRGLHATRGALKKSWLPCWLPREST